MIIYINIYISNNNNIFNDYRIINLYLLVDWIGMEQSK